MNNLCLLRSKLGMDRLEEQLDFKFVSHLNITSQLMLCFFCFDFLVTPRFLEISVRSSLVEEWVKSKRVVNSQPRRQRRFPWPGRRNDLCLDGVEQQKKGSQGRSVVIFKSVIYRKYVEPEHAQKDCSSYHHIQYGWPATPLQVSAATYVSVDHPELHSTRPTVKGQTTTYHQNQPPPYDFIL